LVNKVLQIIAGLGLAIGALMAFGRLAALNALFQRAGLGV
jgi:hypothetical protein